MAIFRRFKRRHTGKRAVSVIVLLLVIGFIIIDLLRFVEQIPKVELTNNVTTDAIVVLTGGSGRLEKGLTLISRGKAKKLFVSGVYRGVDVRRLLEHFQGNREELVCCIKLGYIAESTQGNASETKSWMKQESFNSLRLVTANYHMPRSLKEFRYHMPEINVVPQAVIPKQFKRENWWRWPGTAGLIITEYVKFLTSSVRHIKEQMISKYGFWNKS